MARNLILRAVGADNVPCVNAWLIANASNVHVLGAPEFGRYNGALGTDPANAAEYWGIQVLNTVPAPWASPTSCQNVELFAWDGATRPLEEYVAKGGPPAYTRASAAADAAKQTLSAAESTASDVVGAAKSTAFDLFLGAVAIAVILKFSGD